MSDDARVARDVVAKKVKWLWRDRIPCGMLSVVAGKPDQGKGLLAAYVAAEVSKRGGNVLYSAIEDDAGMMTRPRLEAAGADLDRILLWRFHVPEQMNELSERVRQMGIDLIVMDPFNAHLSGGISRFSDSVRKVTTPLSKLAEATGCAVMVTEHVTKKVAKDAHPLSAIGGSGSGLPAACRMGYLFGIDPSDSDRRVLCPVKSNLREPPGALAFDTDVQELDVVGEVPALLATGETVFDARRLLFSADPNAKPGASPTSGRRRPSGCRSTCSPPTSRSRPGS